jgi:hypothetical protein
MGRRHILAVGERTKKIPFAAYSSQHLNAALQLPQRKEKTDKFGVEKFVCAFPSMPLFNATTATDVVRQAIMAAGRRPYLRAVIGIYFIADTLRVTIIQPINNRFVYPETIGILSEARVQLLKSPFEDTVLFDEHQSTHSLAGTEFAQALLDQLTKNIGDAVIVINVYHDYLQIRHNLYRVCDALLQVMHFMGKKV